MVGVGVEVQVQVQVEVEVEVEHGRRRRTLQTTNLPINVVRALEQPGTHGCWKVWG